MKVIMQTRLKVKLADCIDLQAGFAFKSQRFTAEPEDVHLVKGENVGQGRILWNKSKRWPREEWEKYKKFHLKPQDVVVAMDRPWVLAGLKWAVIREGDAKALLVQRVARLRTCDEGKLAQGFLRYIIASPNFEDYVRPITTGVNIPHISGRQILDYEFPLPPLEVQRKIASILSVYDNLIENNTRRIRILEEMAQSLYREWFVHFRFPGHEKVKLVDSPLGKIPEGWGIAKVSDAANIFRGRSYRGSELVESEGLPFINLKCIERDGGFRRDGIKRYTGKYKEFQTVKQGDFVMAVTDMTQERRIIARAARIPDIDENLGIISMDLVKIVAIEKELSEYLYGTFRYSRFPDEVKQHANGANVLHLSPDRIGESEFFVPPPNLVRKYSDLTANIVEATEVLHLKNINLRHTRDLLLPKLISSEVV